MDSNFVTNNGFNFDMWGSGSLILGLCVVIANFKIITFSHNHCIFSLFIIFGSIGVYIIAFFIVNFMKSSDLYDLFEEYRLILTLILSFLVFSQCQTSTLLTLSSLSLALSKIFHKKTILVLSTTSKKNINSLIAIIEYKEIQKKKRDWDNEKLVPVIVTPVHASETPATSKPTRSAATPGSIHDNHDYHDTQKSGGIPQKITL